MAIKYYTGVPRSGKTYKAMTVLYYTFVENKTSFFDKLLIKYNLKKEKEIEFYNAYTNINQFNFEISENILHLDFNELYNKLKILHNLYLLKKTDFELIEKAKELNIFRTLFVIDECHNYLKAKEDSVLVWWFTYHAHLHHELILITQDLSLVNTEYKRVAEYFYRAIPSRFRMSKNSFKYIQYSTAGMYEKDKIGVDTVKANSKIFSLYVSGSDSNGKSIIHKYIFMAVVALSACIISVYSLMGSIAPVDEETKEEISIQNNTKNETFSQNKTLQTPANTNNQTEISSTLDPAITPIDKPIEKPILKLFKFNCFNLFCYFENNDKKVIEIPHLILMNYFKDIPSENKFIKLSNNRLLIYLLTTSDKFNFITERGNKNEKNDNETTGIIPSTTN